GAREPRHDPWRLQRARGVGPTHAGVRVDRAHDDGLRLAGQVDVVMEPSLSLHEADVLEPLDPLTDPELSHGAVVTHFDAGWSSPSAGASLLRPRRGALLEWWSPIRVLRLLPGLITPLL